MAVPNIVVDTTFSGKNISTVTSVYEYTATVTATLRIQVRLAAVDGGGDYVANLRLNDGDALTDDPVLPKTTLTAASGETAFWFMTMSVDVIAGDVVNVMVKGLAGDQNESGSIRIFSDAAAVAGDAMALTAAERNSIAAALLDLANGVETGVTLRQAQRLELAALAGKLSGAGTPSVTIRDVNDSANRIVATVDADGNRTAVTTNVA